MVSRWLMRSVGAAAMLAAAFTSRLNAQDSTGFTLQGDTTFAVDRIVAVVGNEPILSSQVDEQLFTALSSEGGPKPTTAADTARLKQSILMQLVNDELLVQQARRDTAVKVTDEDVNQAVDQRYKNVRSQFTSEVDFQNELHKSGFTSVDDYRRFLADQQRRVLLRQKLMDRLQETKKLKPVNPTDAELRKAFNDLKGQMGERPATVTFQQLVIAPRASDSAKARTFQLADSIAQALRAGGDFATAAKRFSQDPGSKDQGGDLGWVRRGTFDRKFEAAALSLKPGTISNPVETSFGVHVIQLERAEPNSLHARHILLVPPTTAANVDSARVLAQRLADSARAGVPFDSLQARYHDESEEKQASDIPIDQLPDAYKTALASAGDSATFIGPFELPGPDGRVKFDLLHITGRRPAGPITFDDVQAQLRSKVADNLATERYLDHLRRSTYVDIRTQ